MGGGVECRGDAPIKYARRHARVRACVRAFANTRGHIDLIKNILALHACLFKGLYKYFIFPRQLL